MRRGPRPGHGCYLTLEKILDYNQFMKKVIILFVAFALFSCSYIPFMGKKTDTSSKTAQKTDTSAAKDKTDTGERVDVAEPKPGDIKVLDGVEYIYTRNKKYMLTPYEPEYTWLRKDQYVPGLGETVAGAISGDSKKERTELEQRLAKLEEEAKKKGITPQMAYPAQTASVPTGPTGTRGWAPVCPDVSYPTCARSRSPLLPEGVRQLGSNQERAAFGDTTQETTAPPHRRRLKVTTR